jgi:hypothetical protein
VCDYLNSFSQQKRKPPNDPALAHNDDRGLFPVVARRHKAVGGDFAQFYVQRLDELYVRLG